MQVQRLAASGIPAPITPGKKTGWNGSPLGVIAVNYPVINRIHIPPIIASLALEGLVPVVNYKPSSAPTGPCVLTPAKQGDTGLDDLDWHLG